MRGLVRRWILWKARIELVDLERRMEFYKKLIKKYEADE